MYLTQKLWVIMSKDRKLILKGRTFNHQLVYFPDESCYKRYLTYESKYESDRALNGIKTIKGKDKITNFDENKSISTYLESVEINLSISLV
jgi:hypothetical protein